MKSKTIIISAPEENKSNGRGILTVYQEDDLLKCRMRLYNVERLSVHCKLGIYHNDQVYSANLLEKNGVYETSMVGDFDIDKDFYTAIINTKNNNEVILAGGTYQGLYFNDNSVFSNSDELEQNKQKNTEIVCEETCDKCLNCKYKEYFYSQIKNEELDKAATVKELASFNVENVNRPANIEREEVESMNKVETLINSILPQFEYIFNNYNADEELNSLISSSKFVKINENEEQYSLGAIYENDQLKYICYAVKSDYNLKAPTEIGEHYQWLPLDKEDPLSEGYYVVFQDAKDLKILEL